MQQLHHEKKSAFDIFGWVTLLAVFLAAMNFMNLYAYLLFIGAAFFFVTGMDRIRFPAITMLLIAFSFFLLIIWEGAHDSFNSMLRVFAFPIAYLVGYNILSPRKDEERHKETGVYFMIGLWAFGFGIHYALNFFHNYSYLGKVGDRNTEDFWLGDILAATNQAMMASMMIAVAIAFLLSTNSLWKKLLSAASLVVIFLYNLILSNRNTVVLLLIVFLVAMGAYIKEHAFRKKTVQMILWVLLIVTVIFVLFVGNFFGIRDLWESSNFYDRFFGEEKMDIDEDIRWERKIFYLSNIHRSFLGGGVLFDEAGGYAHDLYLDTMDCAGIFAFLAIVIVVIDATIKAFRLIRAKTVSFQLRQMLLCVMLVFHAVFMVEPILEGAPWLISAFCAVYGAVSRYYDDYLRKSSISLRRTNDKEKDETDENSLAV